MAAAGLPGTGIGGLFYVVAGLLAPLRYAWRRATGQPVNGTAADVCRVAAIALGVIGGIWLAGWVLGLVLVSPSAPMSFIPGRSLVAGSPHAANVLRFAAVVAGMATLALVLGAVEVARIASRRDRQGRGAPPAGHAR
jgi:hypothetical protein